MRSMLSDIKSKILLVEDDQSYVDALRLLLQNDRHIEIVWAATGAEGIQTYRANIHGFAVVILDYELPDHSGTEIAKHLRKLNPDQGFLFASGHRDSDLLIDLLETGGARSFIAKHKPPQETRDRILEAIRHHNETRRVVTPGDYSASKAEIEIRSEGLLGRSQAMLDVVEKIRKFRDKPYPTLLIGATGSGKEYVARALVPAGKKLIDIHCGRYAESEHLLESELFGYVKGAFTGATHDKPGRLAQAHGQVVFFDELHTLPMAAQQKLLRFLETMKYRRMGDDSGPEVSVKFKVIAATQPDIQARIDRGEFLPDLLGRLGDLRINVPDLSERPEDIEPIVRFFQDEFNVNLPAGEQKQFRISTITEMARHPWPLNIRDLRGAVRTLMTLTTSDIINPTDFDQYLASTGHRQKSAPNHRHKSLGDIESDQIRYALRESTNVKEAAGRLGLTRWALTRKLNRLKIQPEAHLQTG